MSERSELTANMNEKNIIEYTKKQWNNTWLIQRLKKPYKEQENKLSVLSEIFSFGGGFRNGGLNEIAMNFLRPIFHFDYMGAAEFEFGAVPRTLGLITRYFICNVHEVGEIEVPTNKGVAKKAEKEYYIKNGKKLKMTKKRMKEMLHLPSTGKVYYICDKFHTEEVKNIIIDLSTDNRKVVKGLKEYSCLDYQLGNSTFAEPREDGAYGWLELDNGFMFFIDRDMFEKTVELCKKFKE